MKVTLSLNKRQLDVLLSAIEVMLLTDCPMTTVPPRGLRLIEAVESAPGFAGSHDADKLAPLYRRLTAM